MHKKFIKTIAVMLAVVMVALCAPVMNIGGMFTIKAAAYTKEGNFGNNVSWKYDTSSKVITVSGSGDMNNYDSAYSWHTLFWGQYIDTNATKIVINNGVTSIGKNVFRNLTKVTSVSIPASVKTIGQSAFEGCSSLSSATLPEALTSIGAYAFKNTKFAKVTMPDGVAAVGDNAFAGVSGLNITCIYGSPAYNYCSAASAAYTLKTPTTACTITPDGASKQVFVNVLINKAPAFNGGNFTLTYDSAVLEPVSTQYSYTFSGAISTAIVYKNNTVSIAVMASDMVTPAECSNYTYTAASIAFKVKTQADTTSVSVTSDVFGFNGGKLSVGVAEAKDVNIHSFDAGTAIKTATCAEEGELKCTCLICGKTEIKKTEKNPANHTGETELRNVKNPTCTEKGYSGDVCCKGCGVVITSGNETAAAGHDYEMTVTKAATCDSTGMATYTCKVCSDTYTEEIAKTGHNYEKSVTAPTCTLSGYTTFTCSGCGDSYIGERVEALGHDYDSNGVCTRCGNVKVLALELVSGSKLALDNDGKTVTSKTLLTVAELKAQISGNAYTIKDKSGKELTADTDKITTGSTITLTGGDTVYTVIIIGDVNGDGAVNASDARLVLRNSAKLETFNATQLLAGDATGDTKINASDARIVLRVAAKLQTF